MNEQGGSVSSESPLRSVSPERLGCLARHWAWADEAWERFEREMTGGLDYDENLAADHPFGSYYHWCALLCGLTDAALDQQLLSPLEIETIRGDLDACVPALRACRQLLMAIPSVMEEQPRITTLTADNLALRQLRRIHEAFGDAIRTERATRQIDAVTA